MKKQIQLVSFISLFFLFACNNESNNKAEETAKETTMKSSITEQAFGTYDGETITKYTLTNAGGMQVGIINYGGTITDIITADKAGNKGNVVLGFDSLSG